MSCWLDAKYRGKLNAFVSTSLNALKATFAMVENNQKGHMNNLSEVLHFAENVFQNKIFSEGIKEHVIRALGSRESLQRTLFVKE